MKIVVFGLGYVGITAAACLADQGHQVVGVDINDEKVAAINAGLSPISEPGLDEMIRIALERGNLCATKDASSHMATCRLAVVCVGTPSMPDGSHNMGFVAEVSRQIASMVTSTRDAPLTIVYRSTMRPGTMEELIWPIFEDALHGRTASIELVYNPEFLRESVAVHDFFNPPKVVIGTKDGHPSEVMNDLNAGITAPVFCTHYREAELTKFVDNTFHAVKVVFANEIGRVCRQLKVDTRIVHEIFVSDTKLNISPYYFRPGGPFGGSCLPKDVRALQYMASDVGAQTHLVDSLLRSNEAHKHFLFEACIKGVSASAKVLMLGLAFKADSDDLRESPNVDLARKFLQHGYELSIYDPNVQPPKLLGQNLGYAYSTLPTMRDLLISKVTAESQTFDLVVDTKGWARSMKICASRVVDINTL